MSFGKRERMLDQIKFGISNSQKELTGLIRKNELKQNKFLENVNEKLIKYQKLILQEKIKQLEHIDELYEYLEQNISKENHKNILFQQKKLHNLRLVLKKEIKKYLRNI
jgi:hypothetical protein